MWEALGPGLLGLCLKMALGLTIETSNFAFEIKVILDLKIPFQVVRSLQ